MTEQEEKKYDVHRATASEMFDKAEKEVTKEQRETAKLVNFGIMYGAWRVKK